jgi:hypothetical protein
MAPHPKKRDFLALRQRETPPEERLCRGLNMAGGMPPALRKQSGSDGLRNTSRDGSILTGHPDSDTRPEPLPLITSRNRRTIGEQQSRSSGSL